MAQNENDSGWGAPESGIDSPENEGMPGRDTAESREQEAREQLDAAVADAPAAPAQQAPRGILATDTQERGDIGKAGTDYATEGGRKDESSVAGYTSLEDVEKSPGGIYNRDRSWSEVYAEWEDIGWKGIYSSKEMRAIEKKAGVQERTLDPVMAYYSKIGSTAMRAWAETKPDNFLGKLGLTRGQVVGIRAAMVGTLAFSPITTAASIGHLVYSQEKNIRNVLEKANIPEDMIPSVSKALHDEWDKGIRGNVDQTGQGEPGVLSTGAKNVGGVPEYVIAHPGASAASISYMNRTPGSWDAFREAKKANAGLTLDQWVAENRTA